MHTKCRILEMYAKNAYMPLLRVFAITTERRKHFCTHAIRRKHFCTHAIRSDTDENITMNYFVLKIYFCRKKSHKKSIFVER